MIYVDKREEKGANALKEHIKEYVHKNMVVFTVPYGSSYYRTVFNLDCLIPTYITFDHKCRGDDVKRLTSTFPN